MLAAKDPTFVGLDDKPKERMTLKQINRDQARFCRFGEAP